MCQGCDLSLSFGGIFIEFLLNLCRHNELLKKRPLLLSLIKINGAGMWLIKPYTQRLDVVNSYMKSRPVTRFICTVFIHIGSGDPVRVLRLFHNKYTG